MQTKVCVECQHDLPLSNFRKSPSGKGHVKKCRSCTADPSRRKASRKLCYVYLMRAVNGAIKIGIADDVDFRLAAIRNNSPIGIELITQAFVVESGELERVLHTRCWDYHLHGEWFLLPEDLVTQIVQEIEQSHQDPAPIFAELEAKRKKNRGRWQKAKALEAKRLARRERTIP